MEVLSLRRVTEPLSRSAFDRHGQRPALNISNKVCSYWLASRCNRNPCRFVHGDPPSDSATQLRSAKRSLVTSQGHPSKRHNPSLKKSQEAEKPKDKSRVCQYWISGNCVYGELCRDLHSWFRGDDFSLFNMLNGHKKAITGVTLPSGTKTLFSSSKDGTVRVWDYHSGKCVKTMNLGGEIGSLTCEDSWVFVGVNNAIKASNVDTPGKEFSLSGPVWKINALEVGRDTLFAGAQNGDIFAWRITTSESNPFLPCGDLKGHKSGVVCFAVGGPSLYSGSMDNTVRIWDIEKLECVQILSGHSAPIMSLICWDAYLFSGSLDKTIKVWGKTEKGDIEAIYTHNQEHGVIKFHGMTGSKKKPVLFTSCTDNSVLMYELPSFVERGRLFAKRDVRGIEICSEGFFFTGDGSGLITVWKWLREGDPMVMGG